MTVEYRSVLSLEGHVGETARAEFQRWLGHPDGLPSDTGIYPLGTDRELTIQLLEPDQDSEELKFSLAEGPPRARWTTSLTVAHGPTRSPRTSWLWVEVDSPKSYSASPSAIKNGVPADLIGGILATTVAHDASAVVTFEPHTISVDDVPDLIRVLKDTDRRYPALVARPPDEDADAWSTLVRDALYGSVGMSSQYLLTRDAARALTLQIGVTNGVPAGGVRIYRPGLDLATRLDGRRHRVLSPRFLGRSGFALTESALRTAALQRAVSLPLPRELRRAETDLRSQWFDLVLATPLPEFSLDDTSASTTGAEPPASLAGSGQDPGDHQELEGPTRSSATTNVDDSRVAAPSGAADPHDAAGAAGQSSPRRDLTEDLAALDQSKKDLEDQLADLTVMLEDEQLETTDALDRARRAEREVRRLRNLLANTTEAPSAWLEDTHPLDLPTDFAEILERLERGDLPFVEYTGDAKVTLALQAQDTLGNTASRAWEALQALNDYGRAVSEGAVKSAGGVHGYLSTTPADYASWSGGHSPVESERVKKRKKWAKARMLPVPDGVGNSTGVAFMEAHFKISGASGNYVRMHYLDDVVKSGKSYVGHLGPHLPNTRT